MRFCRRQLSAYQRRSMRAIETMMGITIAVSILLQAILVKHNLSIAVRYGLALLAIAPVVATIVLVARYLRRENDEYMRNLVVESMLWGLGFVLVADSFFNFVRPYSFLIPYGNLSLDIFVITTSYTLEWKLWRNQ
jgi:hypothetical protein